MAYLWPAKRFYQRWWFWVLTVVLAVVISFVLVVVSTVIGGDIKAHRSHTVVYSVTGSSPETYVQYDFGLVNNARLPWSKSVTVSGLSTAFQITASTGAQGGSVTCSISEDGKQLVKQTASGPVVTARCGSAGS